MNSKLETLKSTKAGGHHYSQVDGNEGLREMGEFISPSQFDRVDVRSVANYGEEQPNPLKEFTFSEKGSVNE